MLTTEPDDRASDEAWEKARDADETDGCAAGRAHDHPGAICRRGSQCHCARPIGHPVPIVLPHEHDARR